MATSTDYYDILGISKTASADDIKKAYRKQALEWHPDRHKDDKEAAEKRFKEINEAYQVLSSPQKRQSYDQFGSAGPGTFAGSYGDPRQGNPFGQGSPFTYTYTTGAGGNPFGNTDFGDPFDIFEAFFGGGSPFGGRSTRVPRYSIILDFMEAAQGVSKEVSVGGKKKKIKIPAGIYEGARIDFGDFTLSVNIKPHKTFERQDDDIYINFAIPYSVAILGGEIKVPTIDGEVKVRIRSGTPGGSMMRLKEHGVPHLRGRGKGDQYIRLNIDVPEGLDHNQRELIEKMKEMGL